MLCTKETIAHNLLVHTCTRGHVFNNWRHVNSESEPVLRKDCRHVAFLPLFTSCGTFQERLHSLSYTVIFPKSTSSDVKDTRIVAELFCRLCMHRLIENLY